MASIGISYAGMQCNLISCGGWIPARLSSGNLRVAAGRGRTFAGLMASVASVLCLVACGCAPAALEKHATAVAAATAPVVDQATAAYQGANAIHNLAEDYEAAAAFDKLDKSDPVYNPRKVQPLLSAAQIDARLAVLQGFQVYVQTLVAVTGGTGSPALDAASKSVGSSLTRLANTAAPGIESGLGIVVASVPTSETTTLNTTSTSSTTTSVSSTTPAAAISPQMQDVLSAGIHALGQYLISRKVKEELPGVVEKMDPQVKLLCELLAQEVDILESQEKIDYDTIIDQQTLFLRLSTKLDPEERREQIMKLPEIARQEHVAQQQLVQLKSSLVNLELTHHALAAEAQGNNPESLKSKLGDLEAAGSNLGKFYSSLSAAK